MNPFGFWAPSPPFALHKLALGIGFALWLLGFLAAQLFLVGLGGIAFMISGIAAIVGGRSVIQSVNGGGAGASWTDEELATMGPGARTGHAIVTGSVLLLIGGMTATAVGYAHYEYWLTLRSQQLQKERGAGTWNPHSGAQFPIGTGTYGWYDALAIGGGRICHSRSNFMTSENELDCTPPTGPALSLGYYGAQRLGLSGERLLWASHVAVGIVTLDGGALKLDSEHRSPALPRAIASAADWLAWDEGAVLVVWDLKTKQLRRFEDSFPAQGPVVLAALDGRLGFGPAKGCSFRSLEPNTGDQECVVRGPSLPVAADSQGRVTVLALQDGELLELNGTRVKSWGRLSSPLALSAVDGALFVVTRDGVYRLLAPGADAEPLFLHSLDWCHTAGAFGELFAWQFGRDVRVIRRDARPLEDFERR